jgi:bla regulator protein blaR1
MGRGLLLMVAAVVLRGQEFEAASIKPSAPMEMGRISVGMRILPGGRISMAGVTAKILIEQAYGVRDFQVVGGPSWLGSERYDVTAKPADAANTDQVKAMIQALLKERFQLQFHRETKELPTYALVVAKGGAKFHEAEAIPEGANQPKGSRASMERGRFSLDRAPVLALANQLGQILGRSVIDKMELTGTYDFKLEWTPEDGGRDNPAQSDTGVSIFTALQDQLGLKLEATKGPVEILVVERAEKATEN